MTPSTASLLNIDASRTDADADSEASGNWMWAAKLPGEGPKMYDIAEAGGALIG